MKRKANKNHLVLVLFILDNIIVVPITFVLLFFARLCKRLGFFNLTNANISLVLF